MSSSAVLYDISWDRRQTKNLTAVYGVIFLCPNVVSLMDFEPYIHSNTYLS